MNVNLKSPSAGKSRALKPGHGDGQLRKYISELRAVGGGRINIGDGLTIRVAVTGSSYCLSWMPPRRPGEKRAPQRTVTIGNVEGANKLTLTQARAAAETLRSRIRDGFDPIVDRKRARDDLEATALARRAQDERDQKELAKILSGQPGEYSVLKAATADQCAMAFLLHAQTGGAEHRQNVARDLRDFIEKSRVGRLRATDITAAMVENFIKQCGVAKARHAHGVISRWFEWLRTHDVIERVVCEKVARPPKPAPRKGVISASDIRKLWVCADELSPAQRDYLRFMLLTPLRRQECADLRISNIARKDGRMAITIPKTKNGESFTFPLVGSARAMVENAIAGRKGDGFIFALTRDGGTMKSWSKFTDRIRAAKGVGDDETLAPFSWHDIRRTFMTQCAELSLGDILTVDAMLNHLSAEMKDGVRQHYNLAALEGPFSRLLTRWCETVAVAVESGDWPDKYQDGGNVHQFSKARG